MDYDAINDRLTKLADNYVRADRSGRGLASTISSMAKDVLPASGALRQLSAVLLSTSSGERRAVTGLKDQMARLREMESEAVISARKLSDMEAAYSSSERKVRVLRDRRNDLKRKPSLMAGEEAELSLIDIRLRKHTDALNKGAKAMEVEERSLMGTQRALAAARREFDESARSVLSVTHALSVASKSAGAIVGATAIVSATHSNLAFNKSLVEANSSLGKRADLWRGALEVQARTGESLGDIVETMREMRSQTALMRPDWVEIAGVSGKLRQGLGASVSDVGSLLNASRALRVSFRDVADSVSRVVDQTSLGVRDTVDLVKELRTVMLQFDRRPGAGALDATLRHVAALEDSLRAEGAEAGGALRILRQFSDMRQRGAQGMMFGSGGPDFLADASRTREVTRNIAEYLRQFKDNALVFAQVADGLGLAADDAQALIRASGQVGAAEARLAASRIDVEQRYREQAAASGAVYGQLLNNLKALLLEGLTPVTEMVQALNGWLSKARTAWESARQALPDWAKTGAKFALTSAALIAVGVASVKAATSLLLVRAALLAVAGVGPGAAGGALGRGLVSRGVATTAAGAGRALALRGAAAVAGSAAAAAVPPASFWRRLAALIGIGGRTLRMAPAGASAAAGAGSLLGSAATSASTFVRGLLPLIIGALPVLLPVVLGAAALYFARKLTVDRWNEETKKNLIDMEMTRRTRGLSEVRDAVGLFARRALDVSSGSEAAARLRAGTQAQRNTLLAAWRRGDFSQDAKAFTRAIEEARRRVEVQRAQIQREAPAAPQGQRDEMQRGLADLLRAVKDLEETQRELASEQTRLNAESRKREAQEAERERARRSVEEAAAKASDSWALPLKRGEVF